MNKLTTSFSSVLAALTLGLTLSACGEEDNSQSIDNAFLRAVESYEGQENVEVEPKSFDLDDYIHEEGAPKAVAPEVYPACFDVFVEDDAVVFDCGLTAFGADPHLVRIDMPENGAVEFFVDGYMLASDVELLAYTAVDDTAYFFVESRQFGGYTSMTAYAVDMDTHVVTDQTTDESWIPIPLPTNYMVQ